MNVEDELAQALRAQSQSTSVPPGDLAAVARRGRTRNHVRSGIFACVALVVVGATAGYAISRPNGETVVETAGETEGTEDLGQDAPNGDAQSGDPNGSTQNDGDPNGAAPNDAAPNETGQPVTTVLPDEAAEDLGDQSDVTEAEVAAAVEAGNLCEFDSSSTPEANVVDVVTLSDGTRIANVVCRLGAYQATDARLFNVDDGFSPVAVDWFDGSAITAETRLFGFVDFLDDDGLSVYARYRGAGDCGIGMEHRWDAQEGRFVLASAVGVIECADVVAEITPDAWPQIYPPIDSAPVVDQGQLAVSEECGADGASRRRADVLDNPNLADCIARTFGANTNATQIWVEDIIDDGDRTLVVWRATAFEGSSAPGSPWGFEELHVTDVVAWTDQLVQRLEWDSPDDADWMYSYRVEFVDAATLRVLVGWHQGACYWIDQMSVSGEPVELAANPYPRPAELEALAANPSLCVHNIEDEPTILAEMFRASESFAYTDND